MKRNVLTSRLLFGYGCLLLMAGSVLSPLTPEARAQADAEWVVETTTNTPTARHENGFIAFNNELYLLGGRGSRPVNRYNIQTKTWSSGATPPLQLHHFQAIRYQDKIYAVGAYSGTCCDAEFGVSHIYTYSPSTNQWAQDAEIPEARRRGSAGAVVYNQKFYIVGGLQGGHGATATSFAWFDEYDPATGEWTVLPDAPRVRDHFHAVVHDDKLFLIGGRDTGQENFLNANIAAVDVYDFASGNWSTLPSQQNLPTVRAGTTSILYRGEILVLGGESSSETNAHSEVEAFSPGQNTWRSLDALNTGRHGTQVTLQDGALYIAAGSGSKGGGPELTSLESYYVEPPPSGVVQTYQPGWNMVGLPLRPDDASYDAVFDALPLIENVAPLTWDNASYVSRAVLDVGVGYWLAVDPEASDPQTQTVLGDPVDAVDIPVKAGWNMIAGPSCDGVTLRGVSSTPPGIITEGSLYSYDKGYQAAYNTTFPRGQLDQGVGYWIHVKSDGSIQAECGAGKSAPPETPAVADAALDAFGILSVTDADGHTQALYFGAYLDDPTSLDAYRLPPLAPAGNFDVRFSDNMRLVEGNEGLIHVQATRLPFRIELLKAPSPNGSFAVDTAHPGQPAVSYPLVEGQAFTLSEADRLHLHSTESPTAAEPDRETPGRFVLRGNYPNPFNPTTTVLVDVPNAARLHLTVFDALGRQRLQFGPVSLPAGEGHALPVDASALPGGVYYYVVEAETAGAVHRATGRMVLMK